MNENRNIITQLVHEEGLPAWKRHGAGPWRALNIDLDRWQVSQRDKYCRMQTDVSIED